MDKELAEMRANAMASAKAGNAEQAEMQQKMENQKQEMEERRRMTLHAICEANALERLNRVALVKPESARAVEDHLIQMAQRGLAQKVDENMVKAVLEQLSIQKQNSAPTVKIQRRKGFDSDDDDDDVL
eukprot:GHVN01004240.1.p2 GENE.GHVN01004240.1~~GHVN01004240.1.p2  ORF type:complete len:129 (-),score=26.85 GHVN01004240.1:1075-1461(-)